jgi:hypothetical protein
MHYITSNGFRIMNGGLEWRRRRQLWFIQELSQNLSGDIADNVGRPVCSRISEIWTVRMSSRVVETGPHFSLL